MDWTMIADVVKGFLTGVFKEMKVVPHTALSAVLLWGLAWTAYLVVYPQITLAAGIVPQVQQLDATMRKLNATLIVDKLDRQLRQIEQELYTLQRELESQRAKKLDVPESIYNRMDVLKNERARLDQRLTSFTRDNAKLLEPVL